jgi:SAM-dependent methyltransferase
MSPDADIKQEVRAFYDSVGWQTIGQGLYQNARYEDLRPVSQEYLHRCHLRVAEHLPRGGTYLLDAGSGPIQYPEYLEYARGYQYRICLDLSYTALVEARARIGSGGLYVIADVAHLPFKPGCVDGLVSLHTIHHLPPEEQIPALEGFLRLLKPGGRAVVVYSWGSQSVLMRLAGPFIGLAGWLARLYRNLTRSGTLITAAIKNPTPDAEKLLRTAGTYTYKHGYASIARGLKPFPGFEIRVWRSVSTPFLRTFIYRPLLGEFWLRLLFLAETLAPHFFGRVGQYPMILFGAPPETPATRGRSD